MPQHTLVFNINQEKMMSSTMTRYYTQAKLLKLILAFLLSLMVMYTLITTVTTQVTVSDDVSDVDLSDVDVPDVSDVLTHRWNAKVITTQVQYTESDVRDVKPQRSKTKLIFRNKNLCALTAAESNYSGHRRVVIVIPSSRNNFERRSLVRQTYGVFRELNNVQILAVVFMLGNADEQGVPATDSHKLQAEIDRFGDIVVGDFVDSYRNLTLKSIMAYEWLTSYCREAEIVLKTDDDVVVNIFQLTKVLNSLSLADVASSIWCGVHYNEPTIKDKRSRFYASPLDFPTGLFPEHCAGVGYVTSINVIDRLVDEISSSFLGRVCTHEDVFMTAIVRNRINLKQNSSGRKHVPIQLINKSGQWQSYVLENGGGDEDHFLSNFMKQTINVNEAQNVNEFRRRYGKIIFYLVSHSNDFRERYLQLWQIIMKSK